MGVFFIPQQRISVEEKLKNPVWYSLKESHNTFLRTHNDVLFYDPDSCIFGAFDDSSKTSLALSEYGKSVEKFFLVSENQTIDIDTKTTVLEKKLLGCQMVLEHLIDTKISEELIKLTTKHMNEVSDLIKLVIPGCYRQHRVKMGEFFGIVKNKQHIAISFHSLHASAFIEDNTLVNH